MKEPEKSSTIPHRFGISFKINLTGFFFLIPLLLLFILNLIGINSGSVENRTIFSVLGSIVLLLSITMFLLVKRSIIKSISLLRKSLYNASIKDFTDRIPVIISDELGRCQTGLNSLIDSFSLHIEKLNTGTELLFSSIEDISSSSKNLLSISNEQAAGVKEVVSTMEDTDSLSRQLAKSIEEINRITIEMKKSFLVGFDLIKQSLVQMKEIGNSNQETLDGIKFLGEKIENIWDIINIINGIADQTKIIAFNAELEATAAGNAGKNFRIVASEIRRLADSTVSSTKEIKSRITEIQHSSDTLIISSEQGTERIKEGIELSSNLQSVFDDVLYSTEIATTSTQKIHDSINHQVYSYELILMTLKQIYEGINNLSAVSQNAITISDTIYETTDELKSNIGEYQLITPPEEKNNV